MLETGSVFAGCRIEGLAGEGGMGVVYRARHVALDRLVAVKLISPHLAGDPNFRERFQRESRIAASIDHPNVIPVYEAGEHDGRLYLVMRYVDGTDLGGLIGREGRLAPERASRIVAQIAEALDAAHATGLVHRDIKPGNVLISQSGGGERVYLTDFGLTKRVTSNASLTGTGNWVGTLHYVSPEQIMGQHVDGRADVYSLGCLLYETLTARVPFERDDPAATIYAHMQAEPPRPSSLIGVSCFDAVVTRAMAKEPADRFQSAGDLGRAALAAAANRPVSSPERSVAVGAASPSGVPAAARAAPIVYPPRMMAPPALADPPPPAHQPRTPVVARFPPAPPKPASPPRPPASPVQLPKGRPEPPSAAPAWARPESPLPPAPPSRAPSGSARRRRNWPRIAAIAVLLLVAAVIAFAVTAAPPPASKGPGSAQPPPPAPNSAISPAELQAFLDRYQADYMLKNASDLRSILDPQVIRSGTTAPLQGVDAVMGQYRTQWNRSGTIIGFSLDRISTDLRRDTAQVRASYDQQVSGNAGSPTGTVRFDIRKSSGMLLITRITIHPASSG